MNSSPAPDLTKRDQEIVEARRSGALSLSEIAGKYGISSERARQIAIEGGVDPREAQRIRAKFVSDRRYQKAEKQAGTILMLYIAGKSYQEIARATNCALIYVREVLDEQITDEVIAARSANRTAKNFPTASKGPREQRPERADRYWNSETVLSALVAFAKEQGGRLPSSTRYQQIAPQREDLPSFATVRNRLGRWSDVRVLVHRSVS